MLCNSSLCNNEFTPKTVNQKYCNPVCARDMRYLKTIGCTSEEYDTFKNAYIKKYGRICFLCRKETKVLNLDHCHTTGRLRAMVCQQCNVYLIWAADLVVANPHALEYVTSFQDPDYQVV